MKKTMVMLVMLFGISMLCMAQGYVDVLYLKDGSVIRGTLMEMVPDQQVKMKVSDGSIYVYSADLVDRIEKETRSTERYRRPYKERSTLRGYKGFIDTGFSFGDENFYELSTSHGYQFNNHIFVGGGMGLHYYYSHEDLVVVPIFAHFRANFMNKKVTPYGDVKLGVSVGDFAGAYGSLGLGLRFSLGGKKALNVMVSLNLQDYDPYDVYYEYGYNGWYHDDWDTFVSGGIKVGFEF